MSLKSIFSSISKKSQTQESYSQCRYILDSGPRCRRQPSVTGSGLCIHHENEILNLRRDDSQDLAAQALSGISDFTSALNINYVAGRILTLALQRRYTTRELDSFTRSLRLLLKSQPEVAFEQSLAKWRAALAPAREPGTPTTSADPKSQRYVVAAGLDRPGSGETHSTQGAPESTDTTNPKTVAPNSSPCRHRKGARTSAAASLRQDSTAQPKSRPAVVAAGLDRPGSGKISDIKDPDEPTDAVNRETILARTNAAVLSNASTTPQNLVTTNPSPQTVGSQQSQGSDHVIWLGPKPILRNDNSSSRSAERHRQSPNTSESIKNRTPSKSDPSPDDSNPTRRPCYTYQEAFAETLRQCRLTNPDLPDYVSDDIAVHNAEFHEKKPHVRPVKFGFRWAGPPRPRRKG